MTCNLGNFRPDEMVLRQHNHINHNFEMTLRFATATIALPPSSAELHQAVETALSQWGTPLRWAVTSVDESNQVAHVEAVVVVSHL